MNVLVVYCHPSKNSFTSIVKDSFIKGLEEAGHDYILSDLYAEGFNPVMTEEEYIREGFYELELSTELLLRVDLDRDGYITENDKALITIL